ncbi:MAG: hypothetical protein WAM91_04625 [Candidatus Acidiferrales bacterium]
MSLASKLGSLSKPRRFLLAACAILSLFAISIPVRAQDRPLQTSDAEVIAPGSIRAQVGFDFLQDETFPLSGLNGDLTNVGVVNLRMGLGRIVEVQIQGMIQEFLSIKSQGASFVALNLPGANSTNDIGDFSMWTKIHLLDEGDHRPAFAMRFGYGMPNSNQARGIGPNASNIYGEGIIEKHFGKLDVFGDLGLAILTSPNALYSQNDETLYGAAFRYPINRRVTVLGEVAGRQSIRAINTGLVGTNSTGQARLGLQIFASGLVWDFAGVAGLTKNDPRAGFTFGVSRDFQLFNWNKM